ncbi:hypothetical protein IAR55_001336 [Kwoniella newhampshirensis]|uniref:Uncharacterized protein n=1 Tax=Kwoniella newhampshirensis TaxID=1651941 RepID=A0AAW0Z5B8_9TREE
MSSLFKRFTPMSPSAPKYVYKILPHPSVDSRFTFPVPLPPSHEFLTELDLNDRFIHLSAAVQIPTTLNLFFKDDPAVTLLRIETERLAAWKKVEWCLPDQTPRTGDMPYLCAHAWPVPLEGEYVESFRKVHRNGDGAKTSGEKGSDSSGSAGWEESLEGKDIKGWLV